MWVVKLGGSLNDDALLPGWLELLAALGGGRVTIVCGGGRFADEVRRSQAHWRFDELDAHNMALLAMAQSTYLAHGLNSKLRLASTLPEIRQVLHTGHTALWLPISLLTDQRGPDTSWDVSSDSIAVDLAHRLNAERLVVVKSCPIDSAASLSELVAAGVLDARFNAFAERAAMPIDVVQSSELARMRSLLLGSAQLPLR